MNLNTLILEYKINPFTNRILNKLESKLYIIREKEVYLKNCTNEQFCDFLSSIYYIKFGYLFQLGKIVDSKMFLNFDILVIIDDNTIDKIRKEPKIENFIKIAKLIEKFIIKRTLIEKLKIDLSSFPQRISLDKYLTDNIENMSREAAMEEIITGITKIEELYKILFNNTDPVMKKFTTLFTLNKKLFEDKYRFWLEVNT